MILLAYGCLVYTLAAFVRRGGVFQLSRSAELWARLLGVVGAAAIAAIALLVLAANPQQTLSLVILLTLVLGSALYLGGLALGRQRTGFALRLVGWGLAVSALAIPSTLSLLMPVACILALTIGPTQERRLALPDRP